MNSAPLTLCAHADIDMDDATLKEAELKRRAEKVFGRIAQHNAEGLADLGTRLHDALAEEMARVESDTTINQIGHQVR